MRAGPEVAAYTKFDKTRWNVTVPPTKGFKISAAGSIFSHTLSEINIGYGYAGTGIGTLRWDQTTPLLADAVYFGRGKGGTGILEVPAGGTVRFGTVSEPLSSLRLAYDDSGGGSSAATNAHLDFTTTDPVVEVYVTTDLSIGRRNSGAGNAAASGSLILGSHSTVVVGTEAAPAVVYIGFNQDFDISSGDNGYGSATGVLDATAPGSQVALELSELNVGRSLAGAASGMMTQGSGAVVRAEIVRIGSGGSASGAYDLQGGTLSAGTVTLGADGTFSFSGGTLELGTFDGDLVQAGGVLTSLAPPGVVTINGVYGLGADATVAIALVESGGNVEHDIVAVSGAAILNGTLSITLVNNPVFAAGQTFDVITYNDHVGEFAQINGLDIGNGLVLQPEYLKTGLRLTVTTEP